MPSTDFVESNNYGTTRNNNAMHAKPDLRVVLKWMIAGSGSVIADVMSLKGLLAILSFGCSIFLSRFSFINQHFR